MAVSQAERRLILLSAGKVAGRRAMGERVERLTGDEICRGRHASVLRQTCRDSGTRRPPTFAEARTAAMISAAV